MSSKRPAAAAAVSKRKTLTRPTARKSAKASTPRKPQRKQRKRKSELDSCTVLHYQSEESGAPVLSLTFSVVHGVPHVNGEALEGADWNMFRRTDYEKFVEAMVHMVDIPGDWDAVDDYDDVFV